MTMATCDTCKYWDSSATRFGTLAGETGQCRAAPPHVDERNGMARWPFTEEGDWCGSHSPSVVWPFKAEDDIPF